jgi:mRNA-degrading endonuclease toxin of MazEF toxin-antitoxin module
LERRLFFAEFNERYGQLRTDVDAWAAIRHSAVIISDNDMNDGPSGLVIVVPITSTRRYLPSHIGLDGQETGLDLVSYAKCEDIKSVADDRLIVRLGVASSGCCDSSLRCNVQVYQFLAMYNSTK